MRNLFIWLFFFITLNRCAGQSALLEKFSFEEGDYYFLATRCNNSDSIANSLGNFYIDDLQTLEEIQKEWTTDEIKPLSATARDWTYIIYICKNQKSIGDGFEIGLKDKYILPLYSWNFYRLNLEQLLKHQSNFKKAIEQKRKITSLKDARKYYNSIIGNNKLIYSPTPKWLTYEGFFSFDYACVKGNCPYKLFQVNDSIVALIKSTYVGEQFELSMTSQSIDTKEEGTFNCTFTVSCNKSLAKKFKLFQLYEKYREYSDFDLTTYWKEEK